MEKVEEASTQVLAPWHFYWRRYHSSLNRLTGWNCN